MFFCSKQKSQPSTAAKRNYTRYYLFSAVILFLDLRVTVLCRSILCREIYFYRNTNENVLNDREFAGPSRATGPGKHSRGAPKHFHGAPLRENF